MEVKSIKLTQVGGFKSLEVPLGPNNEYPGNVTVLIGNNGSGKTSVLRSLATSLSWLVARVRSEKGHGSPISEDVIRIGATTASISIRVMDDRENFALPHTNIEDDLYEWTIAKSRTGRKGDTQSDLLDVSRLADRYRELLTCEEEASLPLIAFYSVDRVVLDIPLKIRSKHTFFQLDGYDNSLSQGVDFRRFFEWFRNREDSENESGISDTALKFIEERLEKNKRLWNELKELAASSKDRQLTAVRAAISALMPGFDNLRVQRKPRLHMSIEKHGETLNVSQLSQGEKSLIALAGDIARRLAMMNPSLLNPLTGDGIVLIDEVDLHLHPQWQREIIPRLTRTFPNCQFVVTTHSPLVISESTNALTYVLRDGELAKVRSQFGSDANSVLLEVMDTDVRNPEINERLEEILDSIQDGNLKAAKNLIGTLEEELPENNLELAKAKLLYKKRLKQIEKDS